MFRKKTRRSAQKNRSRRARNLNHGLFVETLEDRIVLEGDSYSLSGGDVYSGSDFTR